MKHTLLLVTIYAIALCPSCSFDPSERSTVLDTLKFEFTGQYDIDKDGVKDTDAGLSVQPFK